MTCDGCERQKCFGCEYFRIITSCYCKCTGAEIPREQATLTTPNWCPLKGKENDNK